MLLALLQNIEKAVLAKDKPSLMSFVDSFQHFLKRALKDVSLTIDDQEDSSATVKHISTVHISENHDTQALEELQSILTQTKHTNFLLLHLAMEMYQIKRTIEKDYYSDFDIKFVVSKNVIATEIRKTKLNLVSYDFSFLSSQARQTVLGKCHKSTSFLFFRPYLCIMDSSFWHIDDQEVFYMTSSEKKPFKVKRDANGTLIYASTKKLLPNGKFLYVVSPKGGLYIIDAHVDSLHHSTVRAGQPVLCAGYLEIDKGEIVEMDCRSGHYTPDMTNFIMACLHLLEQKLITRECILRSPEFPRDLKVQEVKENGQYALLSDEYNNLRRGLI